ncbi:MAG: DUF3095 domain-containing protein [Cyanobacteriota bacterium]|nr:DUF3095 domain-containing protein [Cyanobacteriota bacterium]
MNTESFYENLPVVNNFIGITDTRNFKSVPRDWYILITDIVDSTQAIKTGRYKDVNLLGACSIVAVLNIAGKIEIPFIFGGDGAAILVPSCLLSKARQALLATRERARTEFGMKLRVGCVPVYDVTAAGYDVKLAKIKISENYYQAAFTGDGLSYATELIKNPESASLYSYKNITGNAEADFSGLECRWKDIPSKHEETVSLIIKAVAENSETSSQIYQKIIEVILSIYGSEDYFNPVAKENLKLAFSYKYLKAETRMRAKSSKLEDKWLYFSKIILENSLGWFLMKFKIKAGGVDWGSYQENTVATTDYKKFDDMLRMVITGSKIKRKQLASYLEENYRQGKLVYGLHISDRVIMTCLVFERNGNQVHFIDGADGGYAIAAKGMKQRINSKVSSGTTTLYG